MLKIFVERVWTVLCRYEGGGMFIVTNEGGREASEDMGEISISLV